MKKKQPRVRSTPPKSEIRPKNKTPSVPPLAMFVGLFVFLGPKCGTSKCRAQPAGQHFDVACVCVMSGTRARAAYNCRARKRSFLRAASERASHACGRMRQLSLARTQSSVDRGVFFGADTRPLSLHCTRFEHTTGFVFESSLPLTVRPDCASTFWTVQIVIAESMMGIEHTAASRPWTVQIVGGGSGGIAESLTGVEHGPECGIMEFQRSRLWEGDLQNP
jgi:hypothetical protein